MLGCGVSCCFHFCTALAAAVTPGPMAPAIAAMLAVHEPLSSVPLPSKSGPPRSWGWCAPRKSLSRGRLQPLRRLPHITRRCERTKVDRHGSSGPAPAPPPAERDDWQTLKSLLPYLWEFRWRVVAALVCLVAAKTANVGVPLLLKELVDYLGAAGTAALAIPVALLIGYGLLRLSTTLFTELREFVFVKVTQRAVRRIALEVFGHLHSLSLRFHLERQTGAVTRDIERGTRGVSSLMGYALFSILPTLVEIALVTGVLLAKYDPWFAGITLATLTVYIAVTVTITEWRTHFRRSMNELDSKANSRAIDSLSITRPSSTSATKRSRNAATTRRCNAGSAPRSCRKLRSPP